MLRRPHWRELLPPGFVTSSGRFGLLIHVVARPTGAAMVRFGFTWMQASVKRVCGPLR